MTADEGHLQNIVPTTEGNPEATPRSMLSWGSLITTRLLKAALSYPG